MAEIQIVYREGYCYFDCPDFLTQCFTGAAGDLGCGHYLGEPIISVHTGREVACGSCRYARFKYIHMGGSWKNYTMEEITDDFNPNLNCMWVTLRRELYECVKVKLGGKVIYNEYDDEGQEDAADETAPDKE